MVGSFPDHEIVDLADVVNRVLRKDSGKIDISIFVVNENESAAVLALLKPLDSTSDKLQAAWMSKHLLWFGRIGSYNCCVAGTTKDMGNHTVFVVSPVLDLLKPWVVISVGIAWGAELNNQKLGDVLVGQELLANYQNTAERGSTTISRLAPIPAGDLLLRRFDYGSRTWRFQRYVAQQLS